MAANMQIKNIGGRIGSYAISTVDLNSWMNEPIVQAPQRSRKARGVKEVVNKIFADCAGVINDPFWIEKFNLAAIGKFPQKFSFHDGALVYRKGAKCHSIDVSNNPYEAAYACMDFFRSHGGIFSPMDEQHSLALQYDRAHAAQTQKQLTWGDANKKMQECMLSHYIMNMKELMGLSDSEVEHLRQTIRLGIANKYFGKHNIRVDNNRIHSIEGLLWNNETRTFYLHPELKPIAARSYSRNKDGPAAVDPSQKDMVPQFVVKWNKYVESIGKKVARHNRRQRRIVIINQHGPQVRHLELVMTPSLTTNATTDVTSTDLTTNDLTTTDDE